MALSKVQKNGLHAAILAYLAANGGRCAPSLAAFKSEAGGGGGDTLAVSGSVLTNAWTTFTNEHAQTMSLETAIVEYLAAGGRPFARTAAAFKQVVQLTGPGSNSNSASSSRSDRVSARNAQISARELVSGPVLVKAWTFLHEFLRCKPKTRAFFKAIESGNLAELQLYVCVGVDVEAFEGGPITDWFSWSPIHCATRFNRLDIVRFFVECGHSTESSASWRVITKRDKYVKYPLFAQSVWWVPTPLHGVTPLHIASQFGHVEVMQYLLEHGADKEKANDNGATPLYVAAQYGYVATAQCLVEHGADKDKADEYGTSPLSIAAKGGFVEVVQCLVERGADKERAKRNGETALFVASQHKQVAVVQYLVEQGACKDTADRIGCTPLHVAAEWGHLAVVHVLVENGADKEKANNDGMTPLMAACLDGHGHVVVPAGTRLRCGPRRRQWLDCSSLRCI